MLHLETVEPRTLHLLKRLMEVPELANFYLVGGTALALRFGHRTSVDLDLFSVQEFENKGIVQVLENQFPTFSHRNVNNPVGVFGYIDGVKVDMVRHHRFQLISPIVSQEEIRMFGDQDIMAMKVYAILQRAQKKDFWDVFELLQTYSVKDFIESYHKKYPSNQMLISIPHALTYFAEADESEEPTSLKGQTWESVKKHIQAAVREYLS